MGTFSFYLKFAMFLFPTLRDSAFGQAYIGCYIDDAGSRTLRMTAAFADNQALTIDKCLGLCSKTGYTLAGAEYSQECYCGNVTDLKSSLKAPESECDMTCDGNPKQICGGGLRLSIYATTNLCERAWQSRCDSNPSQYSLSYRQLAAFNSSTNQCATLPNTFQYRPCNISMENRSEKDTCFSKYKGLSTSNACYFVAGKNKSMFAFESASLACEASGGALAYTMDVDFTMGSLANFLLASSNTATTSYWWGIKMVRESEEEGAFWWLKWDFGTATGQSPYAPVEKQRFKVNFMADSTQICTKLVIRHESNDTETPTVAAILPVDCLASDNVTLPLCMIPKYRSDFTGPTIGKRLIIMDSWTNSSIFTRNPWYCGLECVRQMGKCAAFNWNTASGGCELVPYKVDAVQVGVNYGYFNGIESSIAGKRFFEIVDDPAWRLYNRV